MGMQAIPKRWIIILFVELSDYSNTRQVAVFMSDVENLLHSTLVSLSFENAFRTHFSGPYIGHINPDGLQRCERSDKWGFWGYIRAEAQCIESTNLFLFVCLTTFLFIVSSMDGSNFATFLKSCHHGGYQWQATSNHYANPEYAWQSMEFDGKDLCQSVPLAIIVLS